MTPAKKIRVAVNGYGVIGKRVADAVALQDDMELAGVADISADWRPRIATQRGYRLYAATGDHAEAMRNAGLDVAGNLHDLLEVRDLVVDCTPKRIAAGDVDIYRHRGIRFIVQGGEKRETLAHLHYWSVQLTRPASREEVLYAFAASSRIALIRMDAGLTALNVVKELMADVGRPHDNLYEVALWSDMLMVRGDELFYAHMVDNEAIVIPETIDAIRASCAVITSAEALIARTDAALGIGRLTETLEKR